jgi:hypothetical protein
MHVIFTILPTVEHQWRHNHTHKLLLRSHLLLHSTVTVQAIIRRASGDKLAKFWGWLHPMQCRHEAMFNIAHS